MREKGRERARLRGLRLDERNQHHWMHGQRSGNRGTLPKKAFISVLDRIGTSFFFTNFTEDWTRESMWKHFLRFGTTIDIYIPSKRSKQGKLFGFVKYKDVANVQTLLNRIRLVAVGADWLTIHEAKYRREKGEGAPPLPTWRQRNRNSNQNTDSTENFGAPIPTPDKSLHAWQALERLQKTLEVSCPVRQDELDWLKRCA